MAAEKFAPARELAAQLPSRAKPNCQDARPNLLRRARAQTAQIAPLDSARLRNFLFLFARARPVPIARGLFFNNAEATPRNCNDNEERAM